MNAPSAVMGCRSHLSGRFLPQSLSVRATPPRSRRGIVTRAMEGTYSGKNISPPAVGHHFLHIDDFSTDEIREMLKTAAKVIRSLVDLYTAVTI